MISGSLIILLRIVNFLILARVIISWLPIDKYNPLIQFLYQITEPVLAPARRLVQRSAIGGGMFDFSPIIVLLAIDLLIIPLIARLPF